MCENSTLLNTVEALWIGRYVSFLMMTGIDFDSYCLTAQCVRRVISSHPILTMNMISRLDYMRLLWDKVCLNIPLSVDTILQYPEKKWSWSVISSNDKSDISALFDYFSNEEWSYHALSLNKAVTMDMICRYPDKPWRWDLLSGHPHLTLSMIERHLNKRWRWDRISAHPCLTFEFIMKYSRKSWDWLVISAHPNITMHHIQAYAGLPWNYDCVCQNPNVTLDWIAGDRFQYVSLNWWKLSKVVTMEVVLSIPNKPWNWECLSSNPNICAGVLHLFPLKWSWKVISKRIDVTLKDMKANGLENLQWYWGADGLSVNPNISIEFVEAYPQKQWDWDSLCSNPAIDVVQLYERIPSRVWNFKAFLLNPNITMEFICDHMDIYGKFLFNDVETAQKLYFNLFSHGTEYINKYCCMYSLLAMHDEDYDRYERLIELQVHTSTDALIQNEYLILNILEYIQ